MPLIQNGTNISTSTNNVSEELTVQSRGNCLKLQSDMGTQENKNVLVLNCGDLKNRYLQIGPTAC